MGFIETLNKFGKKIPVNKTELYKEIDEVKGQLESKGVKFKIKDEFDLFEFEILYRSLLNQNLFENAYELFLNQHYDLLDYLNYDEKQKMFNNDIQSLLETSPYFYDEESDTNIYIPYLEPFVNKRYTQDYQILLLKQHRDYVNNYKIQYNTPKKLYGQNIFETDFSSLEKVFEDERHICFYFDPLKAVYIYKKDTKELLNKVIIQDEQSQGDVFLEDVKEIIDDIEHYLYKECLDKMKEKKLICEKTYKKISKKYK